MRRPSALTLLSLSLGFVVCACSGPGESTEATDPGSVVSPVTSTRTTPATTTGAGSTTVTPSTVTVQPELPPTWVGLRDDQSRVGAYDSETGDADWLVAIPDASPIFGASLVRAASDGTVYVETCCEPALGAVYSIEREADPVGASIGFSPAPSPDGRWLATTTGALGVTVVDLDASEVAITLPDLPDASIPIPGTDPIALTNLSWSNDSELLAFNYHTNTETAALLVVDTTTAVSVGDAEVVRRGDPADPTTGTGLAWYLPVFTDVGLLVTENEMHPPFESLATRRGVFLNPSTGIEVATLAYQQGIVIDQDVDSSGRFVIYVLADGSVHWVSTSGNGGVLAPFGFRSASW